MIISNKSILDGYVQNHHEALRPMNKWLKKIKDATCTTTNDLKEMFPTVDYVGNSHYIFNIGGKRFRLIAVVILASNVLDIRFVGSHADYDKIKNCSET